MRPTEDIINELREKLQAITGISRIAIQRPQGGPAGADIEVGVTGPDVDVLREQATRMVDYLQRLPGCMMCARTSRVASSSTSIP